MASLESRPADTSPEAYEIWLKHLRQRPLERRLLDVLALCDQGRELSKAGIRMRHPEYSEEQVELSLRAWWWGEKLYTQAYPGQPIFPP